MVYNKMMHVLADYGFKLRISDISRYIDDPGDTPNVNNALVKHLVQESDTLDFTAKSNANFRAE